MVRTSDLIIEIIKVRDQSGAIIFKEKDRDLEKVLRHLKRRITEKMG